jgi:hypothetical protein
VPGNPGPSIATQLWRRSAPLAAIVVALSLVLAAGSSLAKTLRGTPHGDKLVGTKGADKITGKAGNDTLKGKGGNDTLNGGKGRDKVIGGPGVDRMMGGGGNDLINAADGKRDKAINGGPGTNKCVIDTALELSIAHHCASITAGAHSGAGGPAAGQGLTVQSAQGLMCGSQLPVCPFSISGTGADAPVGTVSGGGGVTAAGGTVTTSGSNWSAGGLYGCTSDGFLRVTIGSEQVDLPVDCTA